MTRAERAVRALIRPDLHRAAAEYGITIQATPVPRQAMPQPLFWAF